MGLLDELSKYKFNPNATSMGLLQAGAQMLANSGPSYQPQGGFGSALGQGLGGFTQGYMGFNQNQQEQEMLRQRMELEQKKLKQEQFRLDNPQRSVDPYFSVVATPQGLMSFNARTGAMSPINVGGKPVMKSNDDVGLQGALSQAKDANQYTKVTLGDGREVMMQKGTAAQLSGSPQYQPTPMHETVGNVTYDFKNPQQAMQDIKTGIREGGSGDAELDALVAASQRQYEQRNGIGQTTADKEAQQVLGKSRAEVAINYPKMEANAMQMISELEALRAHPGMKGMVGAPDSIPGAVNFVFGGSDGKTKLINGTEEAGFQSRLEQLRGGQFMQAYTALKGGGAITEKEGEKAENAIARMQTSQSEKEFIQAIDDFEAIIAKSLESAKSQAGGYAPSGKTAPPPVSNDGWSIQRAK
jgi:hypothetical protein